MQPNVKPKTFTISVDVKEDQDGQWVIKVQEPEDMSEVVEGDTIIWICEPYYSFAVLFGYDSPLEYIGYPSNPDNHSVEAEVAPHAPFGRHKYFITACVNNQIVFSDPDIVVRPKRS